MSHNSYHIQSLSIKFLTHLMPVNLKGLIINLKMPISLKAISSVND